MTALRNEIDLNIKRLMRNAWAHYRQAEKIQRRNNFLTIILLILTIFSLAVSSSDILQKYFGRDHSDVIQLVVIILGAAAAAGAAIQYALNHSQSANEHKVAGAMFSELRKELEVLRLIDDETIVWHLIDLRHIMARSADISKLSPIVSFKIFEECKDLNRADFARADDNADAE